MQYQVYDYTMKKYYRRLNGSNWGWTCFKREAYRFDSIADAETIIEYYKPFNSNEYRILTIKTTTVRIKGRDYNYAF